jgi:PAS domain S-box-containing protein
LLLPDAREIERDDNAADPFGNIREPFGNRELQTAVRIALYKHEAERKLRESEDRFRDLVERSRELICTHDLDGQVLSVNPRVIEVLGYEEHELLGMNIRDVLVPGYRETFDAYLAKRRGNGGRASGEMIVQTRSGERRLWEFSNSLHLENGVTVVRGIAHDVTERKRAEHALSKSQEQHRQLVELSPNAIVIHCDGIIVYANSAAARLHGANAPDEIVGKTALDLVHPEWREQAQERQRIMREEGMVIANAESKLVKLDGTNVDVEVTYMPVVHDGKPAIKAVVADITQRKRVEAAAQAGEARYRHIAANIPGMVYQFVLHADGAMSFPLISEGCQSICGLNPEDVMRDATLIINCIMPEDRAGFDLSVVESATTLQPWKWEGRFRFPNGEVRWGEGASRPERHANGDIVWDGLLMDVTARKEVEQRLRESEEQLRQSQKMESVGHLAGGIAHDFNNLLTVITGYSDLTLRRLEAQNPLRGNVEQIKIASARASGLTRQLLAFSRKQVMKPTWLDMNAVVADMNKMLRRLIGENIDMLTETHCDSCHVLADLGQIEQVIMNIAVNARDAMPRGGKLNIELTKVNLEPRAASRVREIEPGAYVKLSISDTGHGMSAEISKRIFEPFFTTKDTGKGTGLGLSTAYGIVKQSGGEILVRSEVNRGTTFEIYLLCVSETNESHSSPRMPQVSSEATGETVLLVEDEDLVRGMTRQILETAGYRVLEASNGNEAIRIYETCEERIDLLLTDVVMPGISGRELADHLAPRAPEMSVIFMSGYTDDVIMHHRILNRETAFIEKPFTPDNFMRKIREVLDARTAGA